MRLHIQSVDTFSRAIALPKAVPAKGPGAVPANSPGAVAGIAPSGQGPQQAGGLVQADLMQLNRTLHGIDLLGVTCLSMKAIRGKDLFKKFIESNSFASIK